MPALDESNRVPSPRGRFVNKVLNASQIGVLAAVLLAGSPALAAEKRSVPQYDGRADTRGDGAFWIPRVLLAPLWLVYECLVRIPIGAAVTAIEESATTQRAVHVLTFGSEKNAGLAPTFLVDRGMLPAVGGYFWWDDALVTGNHLRVHAVTWGAPLVLATLSDRYDLDDRSSVSLTASFARRRDNLYYGIGPDTPDGARTRYRSRVIDVAPSYERELGRGVHLGTKAGVRDTAFVQPAAGYTIAYQHADLSFDTRSLGLHGAGVRAAVSSDGAFDFASTPKNSWFGYGATLTGFWDIADSARVVTLTATTQLVDPIARDGSIPFTELPTLGGYTTMRGFLPGRMIDRSAAAVTLGYQWPVWSFLDGELEAATGNVFGAGLRGFEPGRLRFSGAVGLRTLSIPEAQLELLTGFGTDTFDQGGKISSFRLVFGATHGF